MALKVQLDDLASLQNEASATNKINENNRRVEDAIENTLSRDGTAPNAMRADLDMNSNRILNLPAPVADTEPVRVVDIALDTLNDAIDDAEASAAAALASQTAAASSASAASSSASAAAASASTASTQATNAATSASNAATSATNAATSASSASTSASQAAASAVTAAGASAAYLYNFDSATADADPGAGDFRLNHATPASATAVYIDNTDRAGNTVTTALDAWDDSTSTIKGQLFIRQADTPTAFLIYNVTGTVVDGTGYRKVTVTSIAAGAGSFTNGSTCIIMFIRAGDAGSVDFNALTADTIAVADLLLFGDASDSNNPNYTTVTNFFKVIALLTAETAPAVDDELPIYDLSATTGDKITLLDLWKVVNNFTEDTAPVAGDFVATYDTSASAPKKVNVNKLGTGKHSVWIPAHSIVPRVTNGAAIGTVELATNKNMIRTLDFDTTTQEFAQFEYWFPKSWDLGTVTFQPMMSHASGSGNIVWGLAGVARSDDDAGDVAFGTAQTSDKTIGTANDIYLGPESSAITIAGTPTAGDSVQFQINRTVASDSLAVDARLHGIRLFFTTNANTDV